MAESMFIENSLSVMLSVCITLAPKSHCLLMDQEQSLQGEGASNWCELVCGLTRFCLRLCHDVIFDMQLCVSCRSKGIFEHIQLSCFP